jgi:hypothetical protein
LTQARWDPYSAQTQQLALRNPRQAPEQFVERAAPGAPPDILRSPILSRPDELHRLAPKGISDRLAGIPITRLAPAQIQPS